jgi:hypothetical protein
MREADADESDELVQQQSEDWEFEDLLLSCIDYKDDGEMKRIKSCELNDCGNETVNEQLDVDSRVNYDEVCDFDDFKMNESF